MLGGERGDRPLDQLALMQEADAAAAQPEIALFPNRLIGQEPEQA